MSSQPRLTDVIGLYFESIEEGARQFFYYIEKRQCIDLLGSGYFFQSQEIVKTARQFIEVGRFVEWEQEMSCNCSDLMSLLVAIFSRYFVFR